MKFITTAVPPVEIIDLERHVDERGSFARVWSADELQERGLNGVNRQSSISRNHRAGTLRGLHVQLAPSAEAKVVRVNRGAIFDVAVDVRASSATFGRHVAVELSAENGRALYVPEGFAHGFQTLVDETEILYFISASFDAASARTIRWDDPTLAIPWPPVERRILSEKDAAAPLLENSGALFP